MGIASAKHKAVWGGRGRDCRRWAGPVGDSLLAKIVYATKQSVAQTTAEIDYQMRRRCRVHCGAEAARQAGQG